MITKIDDCKIKHQINIETFFKTMITLYKKKKNKL